MSGVKLLKKRMSGVRLLPFLNAISCCKGFHIARDSAGKAVSCSLLSNVTCVFTFRV